MGLYPKKGTIAVGSDADIVVWDPNAAHEVRATDQYTRVDYNLYEGVKVSWTPRFVLSRGEAIVRDGRCTADAGRGQFLVREPLGRAQSRGAATVSSQAAPADPVPHMPASAEAT
jgi:dihydropyrimidinase